MSAPQTDKTFTGAIPELYDSVLVPLIFAHYAEDIARRVAAAPVTRVLEIAAGTGAVTRALASSLPPHTTIVATDLNPAMLQQAARVPVARAIDWRQADAMKLPFDDGEFDAVVCQFGVMFFPDKAAGLREARRVLGRGGLLVFNVWDRIEDNELADTVTTALASVFPDDPPRFLARTPHGYHDVPTIAQDIAAAGFTAAPLIETVTARSRAPSARIAAMAFCQGTPLRNEIELRDAARLDEATDAAAALLARRFGPGPIDARMQAHVITVLA